MTGTRQERLKSALYLRIKKRNVFETCPGSIYEKQFRDAQRVPFMLDNTRKPLFPQLGTKKTFLKKTLDFFLTENVA